MVSKSGCKGWLQQRTNLEKTLLSMSTLLFLTLLLLILFGITYQGSKSQETSEEKQTGCQSKDCIETAGQILSKMDDKIDTCRNFYGYACGRYGHSAGEALSVAQSSTDAIYRTLKKLLESSTDIDIEGFDAARALYNTCVNFDGIHKSREDSRDMLNELMEEFGVGSWPIINHFYDDSKLNLAERLTGLILLNIPVVFKMEVVPDYRISGSYIIKISPGGPEVSGSSEDDIREDLYRQNNIISSLLLLGVPEDQADLFAKDILSVDAYYTRIQQDTERKCSQAYLISPQDLMDELNRLLPDLKWESILSVIRRATGINRPFAVELHCMEKINDYTSYLYHDIGLRNVYNYLGWRFFSKFAEFLQPSFTSKQADSQDVTPRWKRCLNLLEQSALPVLTRALSKQQSEERLQNEVRRVARTTLSATERLLNRTRWLNKGHKDRILRQISSVKFQFPFGKEIGGSGGSPLNIPQVTDDNFTSVVIRLQRQKVIRRLRKLEKNGGSQDTEQSWGIPLTKESPPYSDNLGSIPVYFDKIQKPYVVLQGPNWANYGGLGIFIAREISRMLLSQRLGNSPEDHLVLWDLWTTNRNASSCFLNSFAKHLDVNSESEKSGVLKELFLDRSAMEIAYESAKQHAKSRENEFLPGLDLNDEKMFFLSYAQTLCGTDDSHNPSINIPIDERLNSALSDSKVFTQLYGCGSSSAACKVWA